MNPACCGEYPRSRVRKRTRKVRTMEPARLTRVDAKTTQTGRGRSPTPFQYFHMGQCWYGGRPPGFSAAAKQCGENPGRERQCAHEAEDVEEDRQERRARGVTGRRRARRPGII